MLPKGACLPGWFGVLSGAYALQQAGELRKRKTHVICNMQWGEANEFTYAVFERCQWRAHLQQACHWQQQAQVAPSAASIFCSSSRDPHNPGLPCNRDDVPSCCGCAPAHWHSPDCSASRCLALNLATSAGTTPRVWLRRS